MSDKTMIIDGTEIGAGQPPYIIAELSANHNGDIENAKRLLRMAKQAGANAAKLQTYSADTITLNSDNPEFVIEGGKWSGRTLYDLYSEAQTPFEWHAPLFEYAKNLGITIFSSPFDESAVDLLEELQTPAYKIASFEIVDIPLIEYVASKGKPMIISCGMANEQEIEAALNAAQLAGAKDIALLHCVSGYPAPSSEYNLYTIPDMRKKFDTIVGLSDHTLDNTTAVTSIALGAAIIEKHVTLDRNGGGPDDSFSLEEPELKQLCEDTRVAWESLGDVNYAEKASETANIRFRRSLYFVKNVSSGETIDKSMVRSVRPGYGLPPDQIKHVLGRKLLRDALVNTPVTKDHFEH